MMWQSLATGKVSLGVRRTKQTTGNTPTWGLVEGAPRQHPGRQLALSSILTRGAPLTLSSAVVLTACHLGQVLPTRHSSVPCHGLWSQLPGTQRNHTRVHGTVPGSSKQPRFHPSEGDMQGTPFPWSREALGRKGPRKNIAQLWAQTRLCLKAPNSAHLLQA